MSLYDGHSAPPVPQGHGGGGSLKEKNAQKGLHWALCSGKVQPVLGFDVNNLDERNIWFVLESR